ncbi:hypothetical protein GCM10027075_17360 [Streptomyces heilongjiangensis]
MFFLRPESPGGKEENLGVFAARGAGQAHPSASDRRHVRGIGDPTITGVPHMCMSAPPTVTVPPEHI